MVLYHITYNLEQDEELEFVPKIPQKTELDENVTIPRICFADTILNCIRSVNGYPRGEETNYIRVYEFEVDERDNDLMSWKELYSKGYVYDAELTHEFWYMKPIKLKSQVYEIVDFDIQDFFVVSPQIKGKIVSVLCERFGYQEDFFEEMTASYILNDWINDNIEHGDTMRNEVLEKLQHEETIVEEGNPELCYMLFGEYPTIKPQIVKEYNKISMAENIEIKMVDPNKEFVVSACNYYEMREYIHENNFELCWEILDEKYVWNNGGYLYKAKNLDGKIIALLYCSEDNGRYMVAKYEVLRQYRNKGYGGKIIEIFFEQEEIGKEIIEIYPISEDAARFWRKHGIECYV